MEPASVLINIVPNVVLKTFKVVTKNLYNKDIETRLIKKTDFEYIIEEKILLEKFPEIETKPLVLFLNSDEVELIVQQIFVPDVKHKSIEEIRYDFLFIFSQYIGIEIEGCEIFASNLFDILVESCHLTLNKAVSEGSISAHDANTQFRLKLIEDKLDEILISTKEKNGINTISHKEGNEEAYNNLLNLSRKQHEVEIDVISSKYIEELFVPRKKYEEHFHQFLTDLSNTRKYNKSLPIKNKQIDEYNNKIRPQNQKVMKKYPNASKQDLLNEGKLIKEKPVLKPKTITNCFFVMGEAGIGKTNQLCYLAQKYENDYPIIFLNGSRLILSDTKDIERSVTDNFNKISDTKFEDALDSIEKICSHVDKSILFFIDAINECLNLELMRIYLGNLLNYKKEKNIAFIVSCRDIDWRFFENEKAISENIFHVEKPNIDLLSDEEFAEAWKRYKAYFKLEGDVSEEIINICRQPIMLRFFSEAYQGGKVPEKDIKRIEIFNNYWDKKLDGTGEKRKAQEFLFNIVSEMVNQKRADLIETEVEVLTKQTTDNPKTTFSKVLSENIILYKDFDSRIKENKIGFTYEAFFEYVIARYFLKEYGVLDDKNLIAQFKVIIDSVHSFRNLMGAIEYIILLLEDSNEKITNETVYIKMLELLSGYEDKNLRHETITIIKKLKSVSGIEKSLKTLADDKNLEINKATYEIFQSNYEMFDVDFQRDILRILATKSNDEFLQKPIDFILYSYNDLPIKIQKLLIYFSNCDFINTKRKLSKLLLSKRRTHLNVYEIIVVNLLKERDSTIRYNILESLSFDISLLDGKNLNFILKQLIEDENVDHNKLCKIIHDNSKEISNKILINFIEWSLEHCESLVKLQIILLIQDFIENKQISADQKYSDIIYKLIDDSDDDISQRAEEYLLPFL